MHLQLAVFSFYPRPQSGPQFWGGKPTRRPRPRRTSIPDERPSGRVEPIFENGGSAILMSAATFSPGCEISLHLPCKSGRAERGRNPALPRDHLQSELLTAFQLSKRSVERAKWAFGCINHGLQDEAVGEVSLGLFPGLQGCFENGGGLNI